MHIPEEVLGIKEICESEKDVGMQDWRYTSCPLLQLLSRGQEEISLTVQLKEHLAIHPGAQIHHWTGLSLFSFQNHLGIELFKILWLTLSWVTRLHRNQEEKYSEGGLAIKCPCPQTDFKSQAVCCCFVLFFCFFWQLQWSWGTLCCFPVCASLKIYKTISRREGTVLKPKKSALYHS